MKIKEICEKTGLTDRTVRFYIEEGLISPFYVENYLGRKSFDFSEQDLEGLKNIATLRAFGFTVEEIKGLSAGEAECEQIVETVKERTAKNLDESKRRMDVLSVIDPSEKVDFAQLAKKLESPNIAAGNEFVNDKKGRRFLLLLRACITFIAVWFPIVLVAFALVYNFYRIDTPIVRPSFLICAIICLLPSVFTLLIFQKLGGKRKVLRAILIPICLLCLPLGTYFSSKSVVVCVHSYREYRTVSEATCHTVGEKIMKCYTCGDLKNEEVEKLSHVLKTVRGTEPTCLDEGLSDGIICSLCDDVFVAQKVVPKAEHTPVTDEAVAATCKDTGLTEGSHCSLCGEVLVARTVVPQTDDHKPVADKAVPATCKDTGLTEGSHCSLCGEVLVAQKVIAKTNDHTPVTDKAVPATCKKSGLTEGSHCSACGKVLVAQKVIAKTNDHTPVTDKAVAATCKKSGLTEGSHCSVCDKVLVAQSVIPATYNHKFVISKDYTYYQCSSCATKAIQYGNADGSIAGGNNKVKYYVTGDLENCSDFEIVIYGSGDMPDFKKDERPMWNDFVPIAERITICSGITSIGQYSFYCDDASGECDFIMADTVKTVKSHSMQMRIKKLTLGAGVEYVEVNALGDIDEIYIPKSVKKLGLTTLGNETYFYEGTLDDFYKIEIYAHYRTTTVKNYIDTHDSYFLSNIHIYVNAKSITDRSHYWR